MSTAAAPWAWVHRTGQARRLGALLVIGLFFALMTGPSGSTTHPTEGFTGSLLRLRVLGFLAAAVVAWGLSLLRDRYTVRLRAISAAVSPSRLPWLADRRTRYTCYALALAVAVLYPQTLSGYWSEVLVDQIGIYVLLALGLNIVIGLAGLLDLGYIAFYAIGAYSLAFWTGAMPVQPPFHLNPFWVFPLAVAAAMVAGVILGAPTLRLRGDYLAIVTLGFGEIIQIVATNLTSVTGGAQGVIGIPHFSVHVGALRYAWTLDNLPYYYLLLGFVVLVLIAFTLLERSRVGRAWAAIREDEVAAQACGLNTLKYKIMAFAIGASTSGFAGVLFGSKITVLDPAQFSVSQSILILILIVFGGMGSLWGALLGAAVLQWAPAFLRAHQFSWYQQTDLYVYFGALLVAMMIFRPAGLVPSRRRRREIGLAERGIGTADAMSRAAP